MEAEQAPSGGNEEWTDLLAKYDMVQAATMLAWRALLDAYKPSPAGSIDPLPELLLRYRNLSALRLAAEHAMIAYIESGKVGPPK